MKIKVHQASYRKLEDIPPQVVCPCAKAQEGIGRLAGLVLLVDLRQRFRFPSLVCDFCDRTLTVQEVVLVRGCELPEFLNSFVSLAVIDVDAEELELDLPDLVN